MTDPVPKSALPRDLGLRLMSGIVLAVAALGLTVWGVWPFAALVLAVSLAVAWEWGRIVRHGSIDTIFIVHACCVLAATGLAAAGLPAMGLLVILVGAILSALLGFEQLGTASGLGVLYAGLPAVALVWLRAAPDHGLEATLFLLLAVWGTDTGAYFAGRGIGGPKLWPRISPNKTWSGLAGGVVTAMLAGLAVAIWDGGLPIGRMLAGGAVLALLAQAGDLMESALKREHGVKDASTLIPGHGGFMDRVDGLIVAAVVAALFAAVIDIGSPARALLTWG